MALKCGFGLKMMGELEGKKTLDIHWIILCYWIRYASFKQTHHGEALSRQVSGGPIVPEAQRHGSEKKKKKTGFQAEVRRQRSM